MPPTSAFWYARQCRKLGAISAVLLRSLHLTELGLSGRGAIARVGTLWYSLRRIVGISIPMTAISIQRIESMFFRKIHSVVPQLRLLVLLLLLGLFPGCVSNQYMYGLSDSPLPLATTPDPNPVAFGEERPKLDQAEQFFQRPFRPLKKKLGWDVEPIELTDERRTESVEVVQEYLQANGMGDVQIDVRCYQPSVQWERLKANTDMAPFWKYTGGTMSWLQYKLLPNRVFRTDQYDPYTNTLHINSDNVANALYEAASAKQYRRQRHLGVYAALQNAPLVPLVHMGRAGSDALTFADSNGQYEQLEQLYPQVYSNLGATTVSQAFNVVPGASELPFFVSPVAEMTGGLVGEMVGQREVKRHLKDRQPESADDRQADSESDGSPLREPEA